MAYSFMKERGRGGATKGMEKEKQIFFGVLYFTNEKDVQNVFRNQGMTTVPYIAVSA